MLKDRTTSTAGGTLFDDSLGSARASIHAPDLIISLVKVLYRSVFIEGYRHFWQYAVLNSSTAEHCVLVLIPGYLIFALSGDVGAQSKNGD